MVLLVRELTASIYIYVSLIMIILNPTRLAALFQIL